MRRSGIGGLAALAVADLVGASCGGADGPTGGGSGTGEPMSGGTVTYMVHAEGRSLDPTDWASATAASGDGPRGFAIYDALLTTNPETGDARPRLAESLESDDNVTWTMTLKDGVQFSDGTPYDAEAVKFNWERHADPANASPIAAAVGHITETTRNLNNFANDEVDDGLTAFGEARSQEDQVQAIGQVQEVLVDEMPMVPYLRFQFGVVHQPQLHDVEVFGEAVPYFERMWLDQ